MAPKKKKPAPAPGKKGSGVNKSSIANPKKDKLFTPGQVADIFSVDPRTVSRWKGLPKDAPGKAEEPVNRLDYVQTPNGTKRYTGESLVANGVCRNCWTLPGAATGKCACGTNSNG